MSIETIDLPPSARAVISRAAYAVADAILLAISDAPETLTFAAIDQAKAFFDEALDIEIAAQAVR